MYKENKVEMKKVLVTAVLVTPLLAFGQSRVDTTIGSYGFKLALQPKSVTQMDLQNNIQRQIVKQQTKAKVEKAKKLTKEHCTENKCTFKQVLKAVFLGGKFPWETEEQYKDRLQRSTHPSNLPFK